MLFDSFLSFPHPVSMCPTSLSRADEVSIQCSRIDCFEYTVDAFWSQCSQWRFEALAGEDLNWE